MEEVVIRQFSVPMAIVDFIPVVLFIVSAVFLMRDLYHLMSKGAYALLCAGSIMIAFAGSMKALWKLLYAAGICDFEVFNQMFFPVQSVGFVLLGLSLAAMMLFRQTAKQPVNLAVAAAPAVYKGTMLFVGFIVAGTAGVCFSLAGLAAKLKRRLGVILFILAFVLMLSMGYLSSRDSSSAAMNWIEQGVNSVGQLCLLLGVLDLHRHGVRELKAVKA